MKRSAEIKKLYFNKAWGVTEQGGKRAAASVPVPPAVPSEEPRRRQRQRQKGTEPRERADKCDKMIFLN